MPVRSFRGQIGDGGQDRIPLTTRNGSTGYRITKFQVISPSPGASTQEVVCKIWKIKQTTVDALVDFNDPILLGVAVFAQSADSFNTFETVIFDQEVFNQDIFITVDDTQNAAGCNYYLELEAMRLNDNENTAATLKNIRAIKS